MNILTERPPNGPNTIPYSELKAGDVFYCADLTLAEAISLHRLYMRLGFAVDNAAAVSLGLGTLHSPHEDGPSALVVRVERPFYIEEAR